MVTTRDRNNDSSEMLFAVCMIVLSVVIFLAVRNNEKASS